MIRKKQRAPRFKASRSLALPAIAGLAILILAFELIGFAGVHSVLADFRAFWCAGSAVAHGADPYRTAALSPCERPAAPWGLYAAPAGVVVPAPLPPYALALFAAFSLVSFPAAAILWFAVLAACLAAAGLLLQRTLRVTPAVTALMLLLPVAVLWLPFGEVTPLALLGAALAARGLQTERAPLAVAGLILLAFEPHLAAGAWLCVLLFAGRMRLWVAAAGALLLAACIAVNPGALLEYAGTVLPLHALAEVPRPAQYSATWLLDALGVPTPIALRAGAATYVLMLAGGVAVAARLHRRWNDAAVLIFAPLAAAVVGGTFVHASQIALALPFAAMLAARERGRAAVVAALSCAVLAVPWSASGGRQTIVLAGIGICAGLVLVLTQNRALALRALLASIAFAALLALADHASAARTAVHSRTFPAAAQAQRYASAAWGRYIWSEQSAATPADWLGKLPAWFALLVLAGAAVRAASNKEPVLAIRVDQAPAVP